MRASSICIVEDEVELAETFRDYLKDGYSVRCFLDGEDALRALNADYSPDLILTDIKMPNLDGLELMQRLRNQKRETPVIVMSGYADKFHVLNAIDREAVGFLEKPFEPNKLRNLIKRTLQRSMFTQGLKELNQKHEQLKIMSESLFRSYRERFVRAENLLFDEADYQNFEPKMARAFLEQIHKESILEKGIESLGQKIQEIQSEIGSLAAFVRSWDE